MLKSIALVALGFILGVAFTDFPEAECPASPPAPLSAPPATE